MSRAARRQFVALLAAAVVLAGGIFLAIKVSHHGQSSPTLSGQQPTITYGQPTVVPTPPSSTSETPGSQVSDQGSYAIAVPAGSSQVQSVGGAQDELRFQVDNRYSVDVQSQQMRPGETFEMMASLYGPIDTGKRISFGGHRGLLFKTTSGDHVIWTAVGVKGRTAYTLQTYGPQGNVSAARKLILHLAATATLKQS